MMRSIWKRLFTSFTLCFLTSCLLAGPTAADEISDAATVINQHGIRTRNPYVVDRFPLDGKWVDMVVVPPGEPPAVLTERTAMVPESDVAAGINVLPNVPALSWVFGCSATSAAMMFGHYDNMGYPNMYSGPTNGGVFPMDNSAWGYAAINGEQRALCPLSATRQYLDGRSTRGHVDDYWIATNSSASDPFIQNNWPEHPHADCTADFMGTNQSSYNNRDGWTIFYYYPDGSPMVDFKGEEPSRRDGCHGMRLFAESRGYSVVTNFFQLIYGYNGNTKGFTFNDFKNEINAGRPVLIQLEGHTVLGYGYNDSGSVIYIRDTWDHAAHSMTWGGSYSDMKHYAVTVLRLAAPPADKPTVTTAAASSITQSTAVSGGNVTSDGGSVVTARGVCWSTAADPTTANSCTNDGTGTGSFTSTISGLTPNTLYHVRAYATNNKGTAYGNDVTFKTAAAINAPTVSTANVTAVNATTATSGGNVSSDGGSQVTARGVCWSTAADPTTANSCTNDGSGIGSFTSSIAGLTPNTLYHVRAYATNSVGTTYGNDIAFNTAAVPPTVTTSGVSSITAAGAIGGGNVSSDGGSQVTARGVCWSTAADPTTANSRTNDGGGIGSFTSIISGLIPNTVYYVRAYATNGKGTSYGGNVAFKTLVEGADISVRAESGKIRAQVGETILFTITVTNLGPKHATGVLVTLRLQDGLTLIDDDSAGSFDAGSGAWTVGDLAAGASVNLRMTVLVAQEGRWTCSAMRSASAPTDTNAGNDSASAIISTRSLSMPWLPLLLEGE